MTTNSLLLKLVLVTVMLVTLIHGRRFRLKTFGRRSRRYQQPQQLTVVLKRLDQLMTTVNELQATVYDVRETINIVNDSVHPTVGE